MKIVFCGLSITSSWGNGHATTYRGLVRELTLRGHEVLFLERDQPWYAENRDLPQLKYGEVAIYSSIPEFKERFDKDLREADAVIVGSYVPDGAVLGRFVLGEAQGITAFYDIDTPVTLSDVLGRRCNYLNKELVAAYDLYLSFTGGPILKIMEEELGARKARTLYCSVDTENYYPEARDQKWELGYLGTYSADRQPMLKKLLLEPASLLPDRHFVVAGPQYPTSLDWGKNVERIDHVPPKAHRGFYSNMRFTLNVTRKNMVEFGYSPSVRLFEAAACGTPIISDYWDGLEDFFKIGSEILVARNSEEAHAYLTEFSEKERTEIARQALERVVTCHSAKKRAAELETHLLEAYES